jgi:hypothetical protein
MHAYTSGSGCGFIEEGADDRTRGADGDEYKFAGRAEIAQELKADGGSAQEQGADGESHAV